MVPSNRTAGLVPKELVWRVGWLSAVAWFTVAVERDLSVHADTAVPLVTESVVPSPSRSVASIQRARSGMEYLLIAVLAGTKVCTGPQDVPAEVVALAV